MRSLILFLFLSSTAFGQWEPLTPFAYNGDTTTVCFHPNDLWLNDSNWSYITCNDENYQGGIFYRRPDKEPIDSVGFWLRAVDSVLIEITHRTKQISDWLVDTFVRGPLNWGRQDFALKGGAQTADHFLVQVPSMQNDTTENVNGSPVYIGLAAVHRMIMTVWDQPFNDSAAVISIAPPEYYDILGRKMTGGIIIRALGQNRFLVR